MAATMNRRGFVGTVAGLAGAGLLPSWRLFRQKRVIDLTPFCTEYVGLRYQLDKPFAQDGMVYGTDGHVAVRTMLADAPALGDEVRLPNASALPWWSADERWQPWPKRRLVKSDGVDFRCPMCLGKGCFGNTRKCKSCDGDGYRMVLPDDLTAKDREHYTEEELFDFCGYDIPCTVCKTSGWLGDDWCDYCEGNGESRQPDLQRIGDIVIQGMYDAKIRALGDAEFCIVKCEARRDVGTIIRFRGDGFEGLVMPVDRNDWS